LGIKLFNLPLEEWLFFITIPYAIVFTYDCLKRVVTMKLNRQFINSITIILALVLLTIAIMYVDRFYTSVTFFLTAMFLLMQIYIFESKYMGHFYLSYLVIFMFPFLLVNGVLTGSFVTEPVVLYNNSENLAIRVFTIPVEDFVYGMLLYLMNVTIFEKIQEFFEPAESRVLITQN
jgi:lycopene cyclase domain-containing protein